MPIYQHLWSKAVLRLVLVLALVLPLAQSGRAEEPPPGKGALRRLDLGLAYVRQAWVAANPIQGREHKTLCVEFVRPCAVLSTLEGYKTGVRRVGNHYVPRGAWSTLIMKSVPSLLEIFWGGLGYKALDGALLITGADMDHLALARTSHRELEVLALVTAGVRSNAMRLGFDQGKHVEPGTINAIILTNRRLSPRAMTRGIISATEGKSAALQDLDIRSSYQPCRFQATGTGTDNLIIAQGQGAAAKLSGGHSKMGELIARAMYRGVTQAIALQNGLRAGRSVLDRLKERGLGPKSPAHWAGLKKMTALPFYRSWLEQAMALEDAWRRGQVSNLIAWREIHRQAAERCQAPAAVKIDESRGPLAMAMAVLQSCTQTRDHEK